jgi:hypothetical protein
MRALAGAAVLAAAVAPAAQSQSKPVVVVATKSYRLLAWDSGRKVCTQIAAAGHSSSSCGSPRKLGFAQLPYAVGSKTFVGGVASSQARTVDVVFANGAALHLKARHGRRYQGHRVRFFAGREKAVTAVSSLTARDARGHTVQTMQVAPPGPPQPLPPQPPQPCGCPPQTMARACLLVCPYAEPAWTRS